jgi:hypothetical protein
MAKKKKEEFVPHHIRILKERVHEIARIKKLPKEEQAQAMRDLDSKKIEIFSGGAKSYKHFEKSWKANKKSYKVTKYGSLTEVEIGNNKYKFVIKDGDDNRLGACCKAVIRDVNEFTENYGKLPSTKKPVIVRHPLPFQSHIMKGEREVYLVDINSCYWTILRNANIVSERIHQKYVNDKLLRLKAVGNLKKQRVSINYIDGRMVKTTENIEQNPNSWAWDYVIYKAHEAYLKVRKEIGDNVFMFKTDCFYIAKEYVDAVKEVLTKNNFEYSVTKHTVLGMKGSQVAVCNEDGEEKLAHYELTRATISCLQDEQYTIDYEKSVKQNALVKARNKRDKK